MLDRIKQLLTPPIFEDDQKTQVASFLNAILWILLAAAISTLLSFVIFSDDIGTGVISLPIIIGVTLVSLGLMHRGYLKLPSLLVPLLILSVIDFSLYSGDGIRAYTNLVYFLIIVMAGLLLGLPGIIGFTLLIIASMVGLYIAEIQGIVVPELPTPVGTSNLIVLSIAIIMGAALLAVLINSFTTTLTRVRRNEHALAESNHQLQAIRASLEERVAARTRHLEIVATLNERLSAILDLNELLADLVNELKTRFGYYHVHIYLLDETHTHLVVAEGTGSAGAEMKARRHSIPLNTQTSLVVRAVRTGEVVRVDNVRQAEDWLPNSLLPDTYAEMAVPILLDQQIVGVLDVQEDEVAGLDENDAELLRSLANQVAVAIRNARLFAEVEAALAEARAAQQQYLEQSWGAIRATNQAARYLATGSTAPRVDEAKAKLMAAATEAALGQTEPALIAVGDTVSDGNDQRATVLVAPIKLQETIIGTLQMHPSDQPDGSSQPETWGAEDLALIGEILGQFSQAAENIRLTELNRRRAIQEQTIREITDKLRTASNLENLVAIATEALGKQLGATHARLDLGLGNSSGPSQNSRTQVTEK